MTITPEQKQHFKELLQNEQALLEKELATVGHVNPENPADWEANATDLNTVNADENDVADTIEEYENNTAILKQLEIRINEVKRALEKIEQGTYGTCEVCNEAIEEDRLEANPSARTCKAHMN